MDLGGQQPVMNVGNEEQEGDGEVIGGEAAENLNKNLKINQANDAFLAVDGGNEEHQGGEGMVKWGGGRLNKHLKLIRPMMRRKVRMAAMRSIRMEKRW